MSCRLHATAHGLVGCRSLKGLVHFTFDKSVFLAQSLRYHRLIETQSVRYTMTLWIWLPTMFLLAMVTLAAMFAFVIACEKV